MEDVKLKNYMEDFVFARLTQQLPKIDVCQCDLCKFDIAAMVLNSLPAKYVVTNKGEVYTKINFFSQQYEIDVTAEITKAAEIVKAYPRHEKEDN